MKKLIIKILLMFSLVIISYPMICHANAFGPIIMDGYYDDWDDKPHAEVYYGNKPYVMVIHQVCLFRDDENVYIHIKMSEKGYSHIHNMNLRIKTNVSEVFYQVHLEPIRGKNKRTERTGVLTVRLLKNWNQIVGEGYYTRGEGESDSAELYIPLSSLSEDPYSIKDIALNIPDLGKQQIMSIGISTGPYTSILIYSLIPIGSLAYIQYKRQQKNR